MHDSRHHLNSTVREHVVVLGNRLHSCEKLHGFEAISTRSGDRYLGYNDFVVSEIDGLKNLGYVLIGCEGFQFLTLQPYLCSNI